MMMNEVIYNKNDTRNLQGELGKDLKNQQQKGNKKHKTCTAIGNEIICLDCIFSS